MCAFMKPVYTREPFHRGETSHGETIAIPADVYGTLDRFASECDIVRDAELVEGHYWARLSAPGYMDATDWLGPFPTLKSARNAIADAFDVDPDTGADAEVRHLCARHVAVAGFFLGGGRYAVVITA